MHCIHANKCNYISLQRTLNKIFYSYDLSIGYKIGTVNTCRSRQVSDCVHSSRQPLPIYNSHCFILAEGAVKTVNLAFEDPIGFSNKIQTLKQNHENTRNVLMCHISALITIMNMRACKCKCSSSINFFKALRSSTSSKHHQNFQR